MINAEVGMVRFSRVVRNRLMVRGNNSRTHKADCRIAIHR
nr:MAG TPA: hypothetical protein [Caudoviricetes sp.]